jgi:hypothetical protein
MPHAEAGQETKVQSAAALCCRRLALNLLAGENLLSNYHDSAGAIG